MIAVICWCALITPLVGQAPVPPSIAGKRPLVASFDRDGNGRLDRNERDSAAAFVRAEPGWRETPLPAIPPARGRLLRPAEVLSYPDASPYADAVLRTVFMDFADSDWERQLEVFKGSDVEVPAIVTIDGVVYRDVGVHFRGQSSYERVPRGRKRSFNVSFDWGDPKQDFQGVRTLNLLNANSDPSMMRSMLFNQIDGHYLAAPRTTFVRVVINGENWGVYVSVQQFDKEFLRDHFATTAGTRWKVSGEPGARAGLEYQGHDLGKYRSLFEIKSKEDSSAWSALITLTRVLATTPPEALEAALQPMLDIEGTLRFLALDVVFVNNDGYWTRGSDYSLYRDPTGRFHVLPQDANETFSTAIPPGARSRAGGVTLDPLVAIADSTKPLFAKLLAVPSLRARFVAHVEEMAQHWLDWNRLGAMVARYDQLIGDDVRMDTKKLMSNTAYAAGLTALQQFAEQRRTFLLAWRPPS